MDKILKLIIDDYQKQKPSAKYLLELHKVCEMESKFISALNKKQKTEYLKFESITNELTSIELDDFAKFLFEKLIV